MTIRPPTKIKKKKKKKKEKKKKGKKKNPVARDHLRSRCALFVVRRRAARH